MFDPILCESCGAKIRGDRQRCPRCRALIRVPDAAAAARRSRQLAIWAGSLVAVLAAGVGVLWATAESEPAAIPAASVPDPLAARRQPRGAAEQASVESDPRPADERPFLEPSGAGALAYGAGDYGTALEQFQAAVEKNPQDAESHSNLGQVLVRNGRPAEALPHFERAIEIIPDRWAYRFNRARAYGLLGRWEESIAEYRVAQRLFPNDYVTTFNLALALHKSGDDQAAVEQYLQAIVLAPADASFRFALALSYERLDRKSDAANTYEEYLRLNPSAPDAAQVRERIAQLTGSKE
ncbi:MAG TPA: tetratricopeptide repeat protein [Vicinamibacterales bacterium]|nr:tetratricopeptide repeat protein [Vicinamibacterales bacterium]